MSDRITPSKFEEVAPMWWTLADTAGNEADIARAKGRG